MPGELLHLAAHSGAPESLGSDRMRAAARRQLAQFACEGLTEDGLRHCHKMLAAGDDPVMLLDTGFSSALERGDVARAGSHAALLAALRWGGSFGPESNANFGIPPYPRRSAVFLTASKLRHDIAQFTYLKDRGLLGPEVDPILVVYRQLIDTLPSNDREVPVALDVDMRKRIGDVYNRIVHVRPTPRVAIALSSRWDAGRVEAEYLASPRGIVVLDGFLTDEALAELRAFCLESTVWTGNRYNYGRLGAFLRDGFNCPLLLQIAEELQRALPRVIGDHNHLQQLWGFKIGQSLPANSTIHADFAAVNVNFWITPTESNLDDATGGMVIYDTQAPLNWDFDRYNGNLALIHDFLRRANARCVRIPYRQNRVILFNSDLFHATEAVHFKPGYENHRINVTMLYGHRHDDTHHLDQRLDPSIGRKSPRRGPWQSAAFRRSGAGLR